LLFSDTMGSQGFTTNDREAGSNRTTEISEGETTLASSTRRIRNPSPQAISHRNPIVRGAFELSVVSPRTTMISLDEPSLSTAVGYSSQDEDDVVTSRASSNSLSRSHDLPRIRLRQRRVARSLDSSLEEMRETTDHIPADKRQRIVELSGESKERLSLTSPNGNWHPRRFSGSMD
jgi:hypothetical protein